MGSWINRNNFRLTRYFTFGDVIVQYKYLPLELYIFQICHFNNENDTTKEIPTTIESVKCAKKYLLTFRTSQPKLCLVQVQCQRRHLHLLLYSNWCLNYELFLWVSDILSDLPSNNKHEASCHWRSVNDQFFKIWTNEKNFVLDKSLTKTTANVIATLLMESAICWS